MMYIRRFTHYFFLILIIIFSNGMGATEAPKPIVIGVVHSIDFSYAAMMKNSLEMSLEANNKEGGVKGRPLKLVFADDGGKRKTGEDAVKKLIEKEGATMLVGGYESRNTIYTARWANKLDKPFLITTAADDRITQRKWINVYRLNPPSKEYTKGVEELLQQKIKPASMAIVYENSPFGTGSALRMMWFCRENDIEIHKIIPYHKERANPAYFEALLEPLREGPPEMIYMVSYLEDAALLVKTIRELNINSLLIGGAGGFTHPKFITMAGATANGLLTATLWSHSAGYPGTQDYYAEYLKKHSTPPDYHGAEAYSALFVVADALKRADSLKSEDIRKALDKTDLPTPFGPVSFRSYGKYERQNSLSTMVLQIRNDKFEVVWPQDIATADLTLPPGKGIPQTAK
ncbi:MAG: ABC transporter substrate-binding protein [Gammaproteobacteria bacterium]|nr:ABC transporter substrate-binding protein [Gammaproteobacteria bacterium]